MLIATQTVLKTLYEVLILPVTMHAVKALRHYEGNLDTEAPKSYKWWKINEL